MKSNIYFQLQPDSEPELFHCQCAAGTEFDETSAIWRARWLVRTRRAHIATAVRGDENLACWEWNEIQQAAVLIGGKEFDKGVGSTF